MSDSVFQLRKYTDKIATLPVIQLHNISAIGLLIDVSVLRLFGHLLINLSCVMLVT